MATVSVAVLWLLTVAVRFGHRNCAKLGGGLALMLFLVEQYVEPTIRNTKPSFDEGNWPRILERILKLAIPTLYVWLCIFYTLFHAWLNILAECLHFGDREFYKVRCSSGGPL